MKKLFREFLDEGGIDIGDGDGGNIIEGDDNTAIFLDTIDSANDTFERTCENANLTTNLLREILIA